MAKKNGMRTLAFGALIGAGLGVLFAPKSGSETRRELRSAINNMTSKIKEIDVEEVKENFEIQIIKIKEDLANLDKETVLKTAEKKAKELNKKAEQLVEYAIEKGTPVLEKAANGVREQAIKTTKSVLVKLESKEK